MTDHIEQALKLLQECDEALNEATMINDLLECILNQTPKPSEMLEEGYE